MAIDEKKLRRAFEGLASIGALRGSVQERLAEALEREPEPVAENESETAVPAPALASSYQFDCRNRRADLYWQAAQEGLRRIADQGRELPGAMRWAKQHRTVLWEMAISKLPAGWEALWDRGAPLNEFQAAVDAWVEAHAQLCRLYLESGQGSLMEDAPEDFTPPVAGEQSRNVVDERRKKND